MRKAVRILIEKWKCRWRFRNFEVSEMTFAWHIHHEDLIESFYETPQNRIDYIVNSKPYREQARRLRSMRPVKNNGAAHDILTSLRQLGNGYSYIYQRRESLNQQRDYLFGRLEALHKVDCRPDCHWNGRTIFPEYEAQYQGYK